MKAHIFRLLSKIIMSVSFLSSTAMATATATATEGMCRDLFVIESQIEYSPELFEQAYRDEYQKIDSWFRRKSVVHLKEKIRQRVENACEIECTEEKIARVVNEAIGESFGNIDRLNRQGRIIRGYLFLTGMSVGSVLIGTMINTHLPVHEQFLSHVITAVMSLGLYSFSAPLFNHIGTTLVRGAWRLTDGKPFFRKDPEYARLRALYRVLRDKMTTIEQEEATRISTFKNKAAGTFASALEATLSADPSKGGITAGAGRIADFVIDVRISTPEIRYDDPSILRTFKLNIWNRNLDREVLEKLYALTIEMIQNTDELYNQSPEAAQIYQKTLRVWLGLDPG